VRATTLAAGGLACAGAAMTIAAFVAGGGESESDPPPARSAQAAAAAPDGLSVWVANGCGSCHTFSPANSTAPIGPDLMQTLRGKDRAYVERAIVARNTDAAAGYSVGGMPEDFATRISPADMQLLVDFIVEGVRAQ